MAGTVSREALDELRQEIRGLTGNVLDAAGPIEDPAELELLALELMGPLGDPELPVEVAELLPASLEERRDTAGAGVLAALAALGPPRLAGLAAKARDRLAGAGVVSPIAGRIGRLRSGDCYRIPFSEPDSAAVGAIVEREGEGEVQSATVILGQEEGGAVIVEGLVTTPADPALTWERVNMLAPEGASAEPLPEAELVRGLTDALEHMVAGDLDLLHEAAPPLAILERALTGEVGRWPRPYVAEPGPEEEDLDEDLLEFADQLLEMFAERLEQSPETFERLDQMVRTAYLMTDWKIGYADGELTRWTHDDLRAFLLDWYPRKGDSEDEAIAEVAGATVAFLRFLDQEELLSGADIEALEATVARLRPRFEQAAHDPRNWGPSKALVAAMEADGVDPVDKEAVEAWMAEFNARPFEERDRILGGPAASGARRRKGTERRRKGKAARAARKRNRR